MLHQHYQSGSPAFFVWTNLEFWMIWLFIPTKVVMPVFLNASTFSSMAIEDSLVTSPVNLMTLVWSSISSRNSWHVEGKCAAPQWKLLNSADLSDSMLSSICALISAPLVASNLFRDAQACSLSTLCCLCCCLTAVSWSPQWLGRANVV